MSIFNTPNLEAQQGFEDEASTGPQIGMLESFTRAMDFTRLIDNELGVKVALEDAENANFQRIPKQDRDKVERLYTTPIGMGIYQGGTLFGFTDARDVATAVGTRQRHDPSETALDDPAAYARLIGDRDKKLRELQARYPDAGIQTYDEMFRGTRERYDTMKFENAQRSFGKGSNIGWVAGSILAGVDPRTAPLSFASLPIGGVGKTIATRVATQGLGQGAVQAVEEVAGIRSNKRLLGEDPSLAESAANVAFATVGGGALQVVGEAAGGALKIARRRWFKDLPDDPAPPPPEIPKGLPSQAVETAARPLYLQDAPAINAEMEMNITRAVQETAGTSRAGQRVSHVDYAHTVLNMEDWGGPRPWEMQPPTASRIAQPGEYTPPNVPRLGGETIDQIARRIDPDTFKLYDKLATEKRAAQDAVENALNKLDEAVLARLTPMRDKVIELEKKAAEATGKRAKPVQLELAEARADLAERQAVLLGADTTVAAAHRQRVMRIDEKMRDLAPVVSRAYARAEGKWTQHAAQRAQLDEMIAKGDTTLPKTPIDTKIVDDTEALTSKQVADYVPELRGVATRIGEDAADTVKRVYAEESKNIDKALEKVRADLPKMLEPFHETKIVDEAGKPASVYHGGAIGIEAFKAERSHGRFGIYFSKNRNLAEGYAGAIKGTPTTIYEAQLNIKNPLVIKEPGFWTKLRAWMQGKDKRTEVDKTFHMSGQLTAEDIARFKAQGYDGIVNEFSDEIVAFDANQVRIIKAGDKDVSPITTRPQEGDVLRGRGDEATFSVAGTEMKLSLAQKIVIEGEDGFPREVTVRDIMKELDEDTHVLEAVTTCSLAKSTAIV